MNRVAGKVAIVTGAASGLGKATSILLAKEGANVVLADVNESDGKKNAEAIQKEGGQAVFVKLDVTSESDWANVIKVCLERFKKLDILVNCAGIFYGKSIEETSLADWRKVIAINLDGTFLGIKAAVAPMKKNGGGSIVNLSSAGGIIGTSDSSPYNASKGGVRLLTKAAAIEFSKANHNYNIRVNSVHPGVIRTPMTKWMVDDPAAAEPVIKLQPIGRMGEPEDVAYGILYLASDESSYLTGSELVIDGGWTAN
jgi:NAD(P)-dependent dehydrogenase (short-subunit alcohol dehydrogenase family)